MADTVSTPPPADKPDAEAEADPGRRGVILWTGLALLMFCFAVILPFAGRQLYHRYHAYRAGNVAAQAMALIKDERWEAASQVLRDDFKTYGHDPAVLRALGTLFLEGYDDPLMGANLLRQVQACGEATPEDLRKLAHATLRLGDTPEARKLYE
ncbi:MAG: hypothetical protein JWO94_884, partial [Verrucomicrobiaceae bacterium]|nr:hypothetical protein [Verrucomicrobiaceae bacterium]